MRAYISVFDKENIEVLAKNLIDKDFEIVSTSNTAKYLKEKGIKVTDSSNITGFTELLEGRVKSLHPEIFADVLSNQQQRIKENIKGFDVVIVNLYPFEKYKNVEVETQTLLDNIDIGGVALLRAAAKNYQNVVVITDKQDYLIDLDEVLDKTNENCEKIRETLALKAFLTTTKYDNLILDKLSKQFNLENDFKSLALNKIKNLRYGENPHQKASLFDFGKALDYIQLQGKELSYNNIVDASSALELTSEFFDVCCCTIVKHANPCAVALSQDLESAWDKALDSDPISPFGGIVCFSKKVNLSLAKKLAAMFLEVIIAPDFDDDALLELSKKKNLRVLKINTPYEEILKFIDEEIKITPFGVLIQQKDTRDLDVKTFKVISKKKPEQKEVEDMIFAFKVVKHTKSNAIVIAKDLRTIGICGGQTNRVGAVEIALNRVCDSTKDAILASDGFFPAIDNIQVAAQNRISSIIQPAGSIKDDDVIKEADKYGISMISTGIRHFKH